MTNMASKFKEGVHFKKHPFEKRCPSCQETFHSSVRLLTHINCLKREGFSVKEPNGSETFRCPACNQSFGSHGNLWTHVARQHAEKQIECLSCHQLFASVGRLAYNHSCWKHLVKDSQEEKKQQQQREVVIANNHHHHIQPSSAVAAAATVQHVAANMFLNGVVPQGLVVEQAGLHETLDKGQIQECISHCHQLIGSLYRMGLDKAVVRECIPHCHEVLTKLHKQL